MGVNGSVRGLARWILLALRAGRRLLWGAFRIENSRIRTDAAAAPDQWTIEAVGRALQGVELIGVRNLVFDGERFLAAEDPQIHLRPPRPRAFWYRVEAEVEESGQPILPRLFIDDGEGFSENRAIQLQRIRPDCFAKWVLISAKCIRLRFDPFESAGIMPLRSLRFVPLCRLGRKKLHIGRALTRFGSGERFLPTFLELIRDLASALRGLNTSRQFAASDRPDYQRWICDFDYNSERHRSIYEMAIRDFKEPRFSILMPTFNTPKGLLREAIESVLNQIYQEWELCIADDGSTAPHVREMLSRYAERDPRIKTMFRSVKGGVAAATNSAFDLSTGAWVMVVNHEDILREHALAEVALAIHQHPASQIMFSDEDKIRPRGGQRSCPWFKPAFSIDLLRGTNYFSHLTVHRSENIRRVGGWQRRFDGAQDYDLNLRIVDIIDQNAILHIPRILYHSRLSPNVVDSAIGSAAKEHSLAAGQRALIEHIGRSGSSAGVERLEQLPYYRICYPVPSTFPLVSLVVPTRDQVDLLRICIGSILELTTYPRFEILVIDNDSREDETRRYFADLRADQRVRVISYAYPFNYSAINNFAANEAAGSILALINNDIQVISGDWLTEMVSHACRPEVGCVGAKLYYPDGTIQHAGVVLGIGGIAGHSHKHASGVDEGYFGRLKLCQNVSAVTAACLVLRREVFLAAGGLDADELPVAFNDVDLCLKVRCLGLLNVWTPFAELIHHESASRGADDSPEKIARFQEEVQAMQRKWKGALLQDPYYSPNLTLDHEDFRLKTGHGTLISLDLAVGRQPSFADICRERPLRDS